MKFFSIVIFIVLNLSAADMPLEPFVVSTGEANIEVKPDEATLSFQLQVTREKSDDALQFFSERSLAIKTLLNTNNISNQYVTASELEKEPIYHHRSSKSSSSPTYKIAAYRFTRSYTIEIKKLKVYPKLMEALLKMDNIYRSRTNFDISNREEIEEKLMTDAMTKARKKAATMAKIAGADVGYGEYLAGECVTCHQKSGVSRGIPSIAGIDAQAFVSIMTAYRKKELDNKVMQMVAGRLDDEQIVALAAYFSKLSPN